MFSPSFHEISENLKKIQKNLENSDFKQLWRNSLKISGEIYWKLRRKIADLKICNFLKNAIKSVARLSFCGLTEKLNCGLFWVSAMLSLKSDEASLFAMETILFCLFVSLLWVYWFLRDRWVIRFSFIFNLRFNRGIDNSLFHLSKFLLNQIFFSHFSCFNGNIHVFVLWIWAGVRLYNVNALCILGDYFFVGFIHELVNVFWEIDITIWLR